MTSSLTGQVLTALSDYAGRDRRRRVSRLAAACAVDLERCCGPLHARCARVRVCSYCCQYQESDYDFVLRLLTEKGLAWHFEQGDGVEQMVLFADTSCSSTLEDASSAAGGGIHYHGASAVEKRDSIQYLQASRTLGVAVVTVLGYDYEARRSVTVSVPIKFPIGGRNAQAVSCWRCRRRTRSNRRTGAKYSPAVSATPTALAC